MRWINDFFSIDMNALWATQVKSHVKNKMRLPKKNVATPFLVVSNSYKTFKTALVQCISEYKQSGQKSNPTRRMFIARFYTIFPPQKQNKPPPNLFRL